MTPSDEAVQLGHGECGEHATLRTTSVRRVTMARRHAASRSRRWLLNPQSWQAEPYVRNLRDRR